MKKNFKQKNKKENIFKKRGFTLLFAVLVSTLVLSVGASIISIALKQIILSGSARDSQFAFYAANTGIECALYLDIVGVDVSNGSATTTETVFATSTDSNSPSIGQPVKCADTSGIIIDNNDSDGIDSDGDLLPDDNWNLEDSNNSATTTFRALLGDDVSYCVDVSVSKYLDGDGRIKTIVNSRGYNTCDENSKRRIERGLRITY